MPRWKALPEDLDPQLREFAGQMRRLVDRSGLSIAAVADRTGYRKTSWERYLNGRMLAPKGAIVALAEVTGTDPVHLATLWELAERAWGRSEMRHDTTMEAIRISQARAALGGPAAPPSGPRANGSGRVRGVTAAPRAAGPAGAAPVVPSVPAQPMASGSAEAPAGGVRGGAASGTRWGVTGHPDFPPGGGRAAGAGPGARPPAGAPRPGTAGAAAGTAGLGTGDGVYGEPPHGPGRPVPPHGSGRPVGGAGGGKRLTTFLVGTVGALAVMAGAFFLQDGGDRDDRAAPPSPAPPAATRPGPPAGVKCGGERCTGKDAEAMGCTGDLVTTAERVFVGTAVVEVRYSAACGAAWGRVTQAGRGDEVRVTAGRVRQSGAVTEAGDTIAYTPMVAVRTADEAVACVTLASGRSGCTD